MCAKRTIQKFDQTKVVLPIKFMSLDCIIVTLRSETLLYLSTPHLGIIQIIEIQLKIILTN